MCKLITRALWLESVDTCKQKDLFTTTPLSTGNNSIVNGLMSIRNRTHNDGWMDDRIGGDSV